VGSCEYHRIREYLGIDVEDYFHRCGTTGRAGNKGFAYTFITPEQERYAGDIIRALEMSLVPVPDSISTYGQYEVAAYMYFTIITFLHIL
jgi:superfamily II DNA/RNA helicase